MAFNGTPVSNVQVSWGNPIPEDYSEIVNYTATRVGNGTQSKLSAIMALDNVDEGTAQSELQQIETEKTINIDNKQDNNVNNQI